MESVNIRRYNDRIIISNNGTSIGVSYKLAVDAYFVVKRMHKAAKTYDETGVDSPSCSESLGKLAFHRLGLSIVFELDNKLWFDAPYDKAYEIIKAAYGIAMTIDEEMNAIEVIDDQAFLVKSGIGLCLTDNRKIADEAVKLSGISTNTSIVGAPHIIQR